MCKQRTRINQIIHRFARNGKRFRILQYGMVNHGNFLVLPHIFFMMMRAVH